MSSAASDLGEYILGLDLPPFILATLHAKAQAAIREAAEGQRAGEEWRALLGAAQGVLRESDRLDPDGVTWPELRKAVAAVERARQP